VRVVALFPLNFQGKITEVRKIEPHEVGSQHRRTILQASYRDGTLHFPDPRWQCCYLGSGEEKACYCVADEERRVFVIELIDERHYLNGRFIGGHYFFEERLGQLRGQAFSPTALIGLQFTGLIKVREFVYGYEWGRFQLQPDRRRAIDRLLTALLQARFQERFEHFRQHYGDIHDRNLMFEIRPAAQAGFPLLIKDWQGQLRWVRIGLQGIDLR
jgi:hypothetical protein